jgi:hypothetical protein
MKKYLIMAGMALSVAGLVAFTQGTTPPESLAIGALAPKTDLKMSLSNGKEVSLAELKGKNGLLVVFSCNTCPFVVGAEGYGQGWEGRYAQVQKDAQSMNFGMVLVNSNEAKREKGDGLDDMRKHAEKKGYGSIPYALDKNSELANAFGARTTPHVYLFDKDMKLIYKGAIDDSNESPEKVKERYLFKAMQLSSSGKKVDPAETKPVGCSIKRVS